MPNKTNTCSHPEGCTSSPRSKRESQRNSRVLRPTKPLAAMITAPHRRSKPLKASLPEPLGQRQSDLKIRHILVAWLPGKYVTLCCHNSLRTLTI
eukprot:g988.t1